MSNSTRYVAETICFLGQDFYGVYDTETRQWAVYNSREFAVSLAECLNSGELNRDTYVWFSHSKLDGDDVIRTEVES